MKSFLRNFFYRLWTSSQRIWIFCQKSFMGFRKKYIYVSKRKIPGKDFLSWKREDFRPFSDIEPKAFGQLAGNHRSCVGNLTVDCQNCNMRVCRNILMRNWLLTFCFFQPYRKLSGKITVFLKKIYFFRSFSNFEQTIFVFFWQIFGRWSKLLSTCPKEAFEEI